MGKSPVRSKRKPRLSPEMAFIDAVTKKIRKPSGLAAEIAERVRSSPKNTQRGFLRTLPPDVQQELRELRAMWLNGDLLGFSAKSIFCQTKATLAERGIELPVTHCNFCRFLNGEANA